MHMNIRVNIIETLASFRAHVSIGVIFCKLPAEITDSHFTITSLHLLDHVQRLDTSKENVNTTGSET